MERTETTDQGCNRRVKRPFQRSQYDTPIELGVAQSVCKVKGSVTKAGAERTGATVGNRKVFTVKGAVEIERPLSKKSI